MADRKSKKTREESPAQTCKRIIQGRTGKALKSIGLVGAVTGASKYCTDTHKAEIMAALTDAVEKVGKRFAGQGDAASSFTLS